MKDIIEIGLLAVIIIMVLQQRKAGVLKSNPKSRKMVLDTCALIDGRIIELARLGFVPDELVVPEFIIHELQLLADGNDAHKRERARFGLDVVRDLQDGTHATVVIDHSDMGNRPTDDKLVALAKKLGAGLYTTDYNLNKVADIEGVHVLNVNELAQHLRPVALPGEKKTVKILQKGSNPKQGVGYLDDGTMVVVDDAIRYINKLVEVEVTRIHQTMAGKMIFASLINKPTAVAMATPAHTPKKQSEQSKQSSIANRLRSPRRKRPNQHLA